MRKRVWIVCVSVLAICLWLAFHTRDSGKQKTAVGSESQNGVPTQTQTKPDHPSPTSSSALPTSAPPTPTIAQTGIQSSNDISPDVLAVWQAPIEFYGKVEDENDKPVEGANIHFHWTESPIDALHEKPAETSSTNSDANGLFALIGAKGPSLSVEVDKDGYYSSRTNPWSFSYAINGHFTPDAFNPVIFHLRKKGEPVSLVVADFPSFAHVVQLHHDGTPVELDLFSDKIAAPGSGQIKLEWWRDVSAPHASIFDWKCQISAPNGGLQVCDDDFGFQAPQSGYTSSIIVDMPATNQNWQTGIRKSYYIRTSNNDYGRVDFYLMAYNGVYTLHSAINPTGSQNLESQ
jgi:hypothetical protein